MKIKCFNNVVVIELTSALPQYLKRAGVSFGVQLPRHVIPLEEFKLIHYKY